MKIYLAGLEGHFYSPRCDELINIARSGKVNLLSSYFTIRKRNNDYSDAIPYFKDFLLDSGAFSFMSGAKTINWDSYVEEYAEFIKKNKIQKFFELDIDSIVGYKKVKEYRSKLEKITCRQSIPVFHRSRGLNEFFRLCDEYSYVSLGGIAIRHIKQNEYKYFTYFINEAHKRGCKIHGLGFTQTNILEKYHFDSVDSTSWLSGGRFGFIYLFKKNKIIQVRRKENQRVKDYTRADIHNFREWIKFQNYAEVYL